MAKMPPHNLKFYGHLVACILPLLIIVSCSHKPKYEKITIDNMAPRLDVKGRFVDTHGGCLQCFDGTYYLYGSRLGTNNVDTIWNAPFSVYSSPNLRDWTDRGNLLKNAPKGVYYRPYVVFNPKTKKYVLWYNWYETLWKGSAGVAVSESPTGPFVIVNRQAHLSGSSPGDGSLFVDNDGTGYYIYTDIANDYALRVEKLTPDFTDTSRQVSSFIGYGVEAPLMFRRHNVYYILAGTLCAACPQGAEVAVEMSSSPFGPYNFGGEINHQSGHDIAQASSDESVGNEVEHTNGLTGSSKYLRPSQKHPFIRGQQTWVAQIPMVNSNSMYIWMADGWLSAKDGMRGHDSQYWGSPLQFNPDGSIQPLTVSPRWAIVRKRAD
jgi:hypothetical protein